MYYYESQISNYYVCYRNKVTIFIICYFPCLSKDKDSRVLNMIAKLPSCQVRDFMCYGC